MIPVFIALPFALSALTKSIDCGFFLRQLGRSIPLPQPLIPIVALTVLAMNWFLVIALVLNTCIFFVRPIAIGYLSIASIFSLIYWIKYKRPSCGCYGPAVSVHPLLSITINMICINLILGLTSTACTHQSLQYIFITILIGVLLGRQSIHRPLIDLSATAVGKMWIKDDALPLNVIAYLSPKCTSCQSWLPALNIISKQQPVTVISASPISGLSPSIIQQRQSRRAILKEIEYFPTVLVVKQQRIMQRWVEKSPQNILEEIAHFY